MVKYLQELTDEICGLDQLVENHNLQFLCMVVVLGVDQPVKGIALTAKMMIPVQGKGHERW